MKVFIVLAVAVACASGQILLNSPWALPRAVIPAATHVVSQVTATQHHAQDELGQYTYGYSGGPSAKIESKTLDGVTRGGYSYIDANGVLQTVNYVSDALGFRVAATNLPVAPAAPLATLPGPLPVAPAPVAETPEVAKARAEHLAAHAKAAAEAAAAPDN